MTTRLVPGIGRHPTRTEPLAGLERATQHGHSFSVALEWLAENRPQHPLHHFIDLEGAVQTVTADEMRVLARRAAATLGGVGVTAGDRVIIAIDTSASAVAVFHGCGLLGAVPVMRPLPMGAAQRTAWARSLREAVKIVKARAVWIDDILRPLAQTALDGLSAVALCADADLVAPIEITPPTVTPDMLAYIQFTSGTTSNPKAVCITHAAIAANIGSSEMVNTWFTDDCWISWLPLFHDLGLVTGLLVPVIYAQTSALMSPLTFMFDPARWLWAIHHFRGTMSAAPNFAFHICAQRLNDAQLEGLDLSSWRIAYNGAEFIDHRTLERFFARFAPYNFARESMKPSYGMAECVIAVAYHPNDEPLRLDRIDPTALISEGQAIPSSADDALVIIGHGQAIPGHDVRVLDDNGAPVGERVQGHIQFQGPSTMARYFGNPQATADAYDGKWLRTGDLGYLAEGHLFICGRSKDIIIKSGNNYHPHHIEMAAATVDGVRIGSVAAVGVRNPKTGTEDLLLAFETKAKSAEEIQAQQAAIRTAVRRDVGLQIDRLIAVPPRSLPKTTSGKLQRQRIRTLLFQERLPQLP